VEEIEYWSVHNIITNANIYDVDIDHMSFEAALEQIEEAERKRKRKWQGKGKGESSQRRLPLPKR
jgi:hypothetical protein